MARKAKEKELNMDAIANQKIVDVGLNSEMKKSYISYAMSVIVSRALPDVRDGMKPVHRRILYDMYEGKLFYENDFRKSATTVGSVLGKYHPHGDASVYDAMVRLGQDFSLRYPLVQGKGNFGSIDGDPPAAYRYTEAKMSKLAALMLSDIDKETVDFGPNFDDKLKEPQVLPARFPNLLVNGSAGIAVGMATNIPPHNLCEVIDGIIAVMEDPLITFDELLTYIKGPDFPTGAMIMGKSGIRSAYATGRGRIIMRARAEIEEYENGRQRIVISEIPYQVNKQKLERHIDELSREGRIEGIASTRDESDENIHLIVELKKGANANVVLNNLYKFTSMQETFGVIMIALVDNEPKLLSLRQMLDYYIAHQEDVITRRTIFDLKKAEERAHLLEGYKTAIDNIDEVIKIIRSSKSIADAKNNLCERFALDDIQSTAIVQMPLGRLSGMERDKIETEYEEVLAKIADYKDILSSETRVHEIIKSDLLAVKEKYGDDRRTEICPVANEIDMEDLIDEEDVIITVTHNGYIKRLPVDTYKTQHRGGRGIAGLTTREEDFAEHMFSTSTHDTLLFFTTRGICYKLKAYQIPEGGRTAKGTAVVNLLPLEDGEQVSAVLNVDSFEAGRYITFITKNGIIKRTGLMNYSRVRQNGLRAIGLGEDDELIKVMITDGGSDIMVVTRMGMCIRFAESDVRETGRTAIGVRAVRLREGDSVIGAVNPAESAKLLTVTENGYGKKTSLDEFNVQNRGGIGVRAYKITGKTGPLAGVQMVTDDDDIMMITSDGVVIRIHTAEISTYGRNTQGVKLMRLADGVRVASTAKTAAVDGEADEAAEDIERNEEE